MKHLSHFLKYYLQAIPELVAAYLALVVFMVVADRFFPLVWGSLGLSGVVVLITGMLGACIVLGIQGRSREGQGDDFLEVRPIEKRSRLCYQVLFHCLVLLLPLVICYLMILLKYEARLSSYQDLAVWSVLVILQIFLWNVVGSVMRSYFQMVLVLLGIYLPLFLTYGVAEAISSQAGNELILALLLGFVGLLSLVGLIEGISSRAKIAFLLFSINALCLAVSAIGCVKIVTRLVPKSEPAIYYGSSIKAAFPASTREKKKTFRDHWNSLEISSENRDEVFLPLSGEPNPYWDYRGVCQRQDVFTEIIAWNFSEGVSVEPASRTSGRFRKSETVFSKEDHCFRS